MRLSIVVAGFLALLPLPALAQFQSEIYDPKFDAPGAGRPSLQCVPKDECLVIVNNADGFLITGLYVADANTRGKRRWSLNQFRTDFVLQTHKAWWSHRSLDFGCVVQAKVEMRDLKQRKLTQTDPQPFDLCHDPVTVIYVNPTAPKRHPTVTVLPAQ